MICFPWHPVSYSGDHAQVFAVLVKNREITVTLACHDLFDIIDDIVPQR